MAKKRGVLPKSWNIRNNFLKHWRRNLLILVFVVLGIFAYRKITQEPAGVTTYKVSRTSLIEDFTANGNIKAKRKADLKFLAPGRISWVGVQAGDEVKTNQVIARQDSVSLASTYQQALNNLRNFEATANLVLDNVQGHEQDENFTQKAQRTTAEVNRDNAYQSVLAARDALTNSSLVSPFAGTILNINGLFQGINLTGSDLETKYIRVVDLNSLYFEAKVDEVDYSKVQVGQKVRVDVDAFQNQICGGAVSFVSRDGKETAGGVITLPVEVTFDNCTLDYALGLNGQAHFITSQKDGVLVIPRKYLVTKGESSYVWRQIGKTSKQRELVKVNLGALTTSDAEVNDGLAEGDTIVFVP